MTDLLLQLRANGPISPAVQLRELLMFGRERGWTFDTAWRWSWERIKWPHDTAHRLEWKGILGVSVTDTTRLVVQHREVWRSGYERLPQTKQERGAGRLLTSV